MQVQRHAHHAVRMTQVAAPRGCTVAGACLLSFVRQFDASPAKAAYLKSP